MRVFRVTALFLLVACGGCASVHDGSKDAPITPRQGVVVAEHRLACEVGKSILERGGNAADAAVATAFALAVVYPQAGNLGGGGFAIHVPHTGDPLALDFREVTPASYGPELYLDDEGARVRDRSLRGPLSVGVPGSPAGLVELKERFGSGNLTLEQLVEPAIRLAYEGFPVDPILAELLASPEHREKLVRSPLASQIFYPDGEPLAVGAILQQPELARTLERIADDGTRGFYKGAVARAITAELERIPVPGDATIAQRMTLEDLRDYRPQWRTPLRGWFRGQELITMPPPSSGGVCLLQTLTILEGLPLDADRLETRALAAKGEGFGGEVIAAGGLSVRMVHWWIEAMRRSFADRAEHLGDPDFVDVPVAELLSREWIAQRRISIGEAADPDIGPMPPIVREGTETTHVSVIDREGNAVSLTTTLNSFFGSGILVAGAGVFLNNELDDFAIQVGSPNQFGLVGSEANALAPGKRPLSSMTPTVVRDNRRAVRMVLGSPGGPKIITSIVQVILRTLVLEQDLATAVTAPRLHQQWNPPHTLFERGWNPDLVSALATNKNHEGRFSETSFGSVQAILIEAGGEASGFSDPRRGGVAAIEGQPVPYPSRRSPASRVDETVH